MTNQWQTGFIIFVNCVKELKIVLTKIAHCELTQPATPFSKNIQLNQFIYIVYNTTTYKSSLCELVQLFIAHFHKSYT